jgi:hypothetical protein
MSAMKFLRFLATLARLAVTLVALLLVARGIFELVTPLQTMHLVRELMLYVDPWLMQAVRGAGLPWSREVRGFVLPGFGVALFVLRMVVEDPIERLAWRIQQGRKRRAAAQTRPAVPENAPMPDLSVPAPAPAPAAPAAPAAASMAATMLMPGGMAGAARSAAAGNAVLRIGRYEILGELGRGAMGIVYKALDPKIGRTVAIKTISVIGDADMEQYRARFLVEAKSAGRLNHPGVVAVYDVTDDDQGHPCLVLEYVEGSTLDKVVAAGGVPLARIVGHVAEVARALAYAHANGIVHRDIKPANVMITRDGRAKLSDFGIAKLDNSGLTVAGQVMGTPAFMSPEQCSGHPVDARSDIFSLGTVLYMLCTGQKPFPGDTLTSVAYKVVHTNAVPPREAMPSLPEELERIILRCLEKRPEDRYPSAAELAADLEALGATL